MAAVPVTSDSAILGRFFDLSGEKPSATLARSIKAHYRLAEEVVPQASAVRATAEAEMETARRAGLAGDIEAVYKAVSGGASFDDLALGPNPLIAAQANLDNASRMEVAAKKATRAASDFVAICAREPAAKMPAKMDKAYLKVTVDLDPAKTTMAEAAAAEGLAEILARVLFQVAVIVEEVPAGPVRRELQAAYNGRPLKRPQRRDIEDRLNLEDKKRRDKEAVVVAKSAAVRAQMSGNAVSTGAAPMTDADKLAVRQSAARVSGHEIPTAAEVASK
ncbi:MAG: hypothetical protein V3S60_01270 [Acidimicrobiia bacterium]